MEPIIVVVGLGLGIILGVDQCEQTIRNCVPIIYFTHTHIYKGKGRCTGNISCLLETLIAEYIFSINIAGFI